MPIITSTDENFEKDVLKNKKPVLMDFWASWCGPCLSLSKILEEIAEEMKDQIVIAKHNIDDHPNQPSRYGVRSIPTMILFKNGELAGTKVGVTTKSNILDFIKKNI
jgi:thioredoxin 1|tara:strand:- start:247 stop:567 length:321 start_codon:yes stop_codon:yes gene_type:complete